MFATPNVIYHDVLCFVLFLVCLYVCVCECLLHNSMRMYTSNQFSYVRGPLRQCRSIRPGTSGLPYYCAPLVCVSAEIDSLAVWRHNKPKTKNQRLCWKYYDATNKQTNKMMMYSQSHLG